MTDCETKWRFRSLPHRRDSDGALPLEKPAHRSDRVLGWNRNAHVHMVRHQVTLNDLAFFLPGERVEDCAQLPTRLAEDGLRRRLDPNTTWYLQSHFEWDRL